MSLNLEKTLLYTIMTIKGTARRAWHLAIWPKMSRLGPTMMISTAPNWRRPQSGCQESASRFDTVETSYSTSNDDRSTGVLINRCCNCWAYRTKFYGGENGGAEFGEQKNYGLTFVTRHPYPHRHSLAPPSPFLSDAPIASWLFFFTFIVIWLGVYVVRPPKIPPLHFPM